MYDVLIHKVVGFKPFHHVLKTGPDRPVQPGTGRGSGSLMLKNRYSCEPVKTGPVEPVKTGNFKKYLFFSFFVFFI